MPARCAAAGAALEPDEFIVVGDTPYDIRAARAAGARVLAVPTGRHGKDELAALAPDALLDTLRQPPDWHRAQPG